jgi:hypothetical protein
MPDEEKMKQEMLALAELVYELSEKYGGRYISVSKVANSVYSWTTYENNGELVNADYISPKAEDEENG